MTSLAHDLRHRRHCPHVFSIINSFQLHLLLHYSYTMLRSQITRIVRPVIAIPAAARRVSPTSFIHTRSSLCVQPRLYTTTTPPPPGQPAGSSKQQNSGSNGILYGALGLAAAAGAYYYFTGEDVGNLQKKAKEDQEAMSRKAHESVDAGKARADDAYKQAQGKYDEIKASSIIKHLLTYCIN